MQDDKPAPLNYEGMQKVDFDFNLYHKAAKHFEWNEA